MRVALFVTCLADTLYPSVGRATVTLLERLGVEVVLAAFVAWVWLGETLSTAQLLGGGVVLVGVVLAQTAR